MNPHEEAFVKTFIIKDKRDRYCQLLGSPKRRREFLKSFTTILTTTGLALPTTRRAITASTTWRRC